MPGGIGIVGYGTIGSYLVSKINEDRNLCVEFVYDVDKDKLSNLDASLVLGSLEEAGERRADLIVEAAGPEWVRSYAPYVLEYADLLIASVGAFAEEGLKERLDAVAKANKTHYYISHGGILGLDGVRDGRDLLEDVRITTIRPQEGYHLTDIKEKISKRTTLYEGSVRQACERFPRDVNIFASLALNGVGFDKTHASIIVDPDASVMRHIIEIKGRGLAWKIEVQTKPKRTATKVKGYYVPESFFQTVKRICSQHYGAVLI
jgi:aspartate dehydrogenase